MQFRYIDLIRECNPLVHCMTNIVVTNFSANGLLALGASPFMSTMSEEAAEIQQFSNALLLNIGTIHDFDVDAMIIAGQAANQHSVPVVLDPVGAGATAYRRTTVKKILDKVNISAIRGNVSEVASLAGVEWQVKGVDAGRGNGDIAEIARITAQKYQCCVAISGEIDYISDGKQVAQIYNGTTLLPKITGSGCLLGATVGAFLGVAEKGDEFNACLEAGTGFAVAGELAAQGLNNQLGSFAVQFINQLADLTSEKINQLARIEYV